MARVVEFGQFRKSHQPYPSPRNVSSRRGGCRRRLHHNYEWWKQTGYQATKHPYVVGKRYMFGTPDGRLRSASSRSSGSLHSPGRTPFGMHGGISHEVQQVPCE